VRDGLADLHWGFGHWWEILESQKEQVNEGRSPSHNQGYYSVRNVSKRYFYICQIEALLV
jgi:hypothetical protein